MFKRENMYNWRSFVRTRADKKVLGTSLNTQFAVRSWPRTGLQSLGIHIIWQTVFQSMVHNNAFSSLLRYTRFSEKRAPEACKL